MTAAAPAAAPGDASVPRLPRGVRLHHDQVRGGWTILAPERVIETDMVGAEILRRCDGVRTLAAIVDDLAASFDADRGVIERDVRAFLTDLAEKRMLEV